MPTFTKLLRAAALSAAVGTALTVAPVAYAAGAIDGSGMHGGGFGGSGFRGGGFHGPVAFHRGFQHGWHGRYGGHWRNGVWVGGTWAPDCDPYSPYFDRTTGTATEKQASLFMRHANQSNSA